MPKAKFEEIYRDLKRRIEDGEYLYSELMPSENTLIGIYNCSRNTIRRAIAGLVDCGYVQAIHGKGVQVIFQPAEKATFAVGGIETFKESAARNKLRSVTKVVRFKTVLVDNTLSTKTLFPVGSEVLWVERV